MLLWRGALAVVLGCGLVYVAVAHASAPLAYAAPPITVAVLLGTMALAGPRKRSASLRRGPGLWPTPSTMGDRALLEARAGQALRDGSGLTLLSVRLDGLDDVTDTLGTPAREALVAEAGMRVTACLHADDTAVRLGVDEFTVLLPNGGPDRGALVADQISRRLREPITIAGVSLVASGSIGVATNAADLDALVRAANLAMHQATSEGGDRVRVYSRQLLHEAQQRLNIESELREAVAGASLCVYFQPIVDTRSGRVLSVEALVRWDHPNLGLLTPPQFLEAAERAGLMVDLGRHVLELACQQLVEWRRQWPDLAVAVNISEQELVHPRFAEHALATLSRFGLPTSALHLEVTETVAVGEDTISVALEPLAAAGVACSLDDFGTGHSSLHRLRRLPVQRLKIDKSFVAELSNGQGAGPLLASILSMAHGMGHIVVAEGVETRDQAAFLTEHGCDELQGYLFSRPVPADQVATLLSHLAATVVAGAVSHHPAGHR
jgi:diguanylate cyclase (GGDEF)-like protein